MFNHYEAVGYRTLYFLKAENETSQAMKQEARKAATSGKSNFEMIRAVAEAYTTTHKC